MADLGMIKHQFYDSADDVGVELVKIIPYIGRSASGD